VLERCPFTIDKVLPKIGTFLYQENYKDFSAINGNITEMRWKLLGSIILLPCHQIRQEAMNRRREKNRCKGAYTTHNTSLEQKQTYNERGWMTLLLIFGQKISSTKNHYLVCIMKAI